MLPHVCKAPLVHPRVLFQKIEQVRHPRFDLALRLFRQQDPTTRIHDIAVALAVVGVAADHLFQRLVVVADRDAGIGIAIDIDRRDGHSEHDPALAVLHRVAAHAGFPGGVHFFECTPDMLCRSVFPVGVQIDAVLVEQI